MFNWFKKQPEKERLVPGTWYYVLTDKNEEVYAMLKEIDFCGGINCYRFICPYTNVFIGQEHRISLKHHKVAKTCH